MRLILQNALSFAERNQTMIALIIIFFIGLFSYCTMTTGQGWGDDFALYLLHAKNITEGNPYTETGYIFNPLAPSYSPQNYPPGFPVLIAPIYALSGLNLTPYKFLMLFSFLCILWLTYLLLRDQIPFYYLVVILCMFGMSPYFSSLLDDILSDYPAALFVLLVLYLEIKRAYKNSLLLAIVQGVCIYIAYAMRPTGIVLIPALAYNYFVTHKRNDKYFLIVIASFLIPACIQYFLMPHENGYLSMLQMKYAGQSFHAVMSDIFLQATRYIDSLSRLTLYGGINAYLNKLLTTCLFSLFMIGWYLHARKKFNFIDVFIILYIGIIILWPFYQGIRFLLPVIPFYLYYIYYAIHHIDIPLFKKFTFSSIIILIFIIYTGYFTHVQYGETGKRVQSEASLQVFNFIKKNTGEHAVLMSTKPRAFTLFTGRKGIVFPDPVNWSQYDDCLRNNNVSYIITGFIDYFPQAKEAAQNDSTKFISVFRNDSFEVFKINR